MSMILVLLSLLRAGWRACVDSCRRAHSFMMRPYYKPHALSVGAYVCGESDLAVAEEIDGDEEASGDETMVVGSVEEALAEAAAGEEVGARRRGRVRVIKRRKIVAAVNPPGMAPSMIQTTLGFDSGADVLAGAIAQCVETPEATFWGRKLVVPSDLAGDFVLVGAFVGMKNVLPGGNPIPCRAYDEHRGGGTFILPRCPQTTRIRLQVQNVGGGPARFRASLDGVIKEPIG